MDRGHQCDVHSTHKMVAQFVVAMITKGVTLVYLNTVIRWTCLTRQTSKWVDSLYLYRQYAHICLYMKRHDLGQSPT